MFRMDNEVYFWGRSIVMDYTQIVLLHVATIKPFGSFALIQSADCV